MDGKKVKKIRSVFLVSFCACFFVILVNLTGIFGYLENKTYDYIMRMTSGFTKPSEDIILVILDQGSIEWGTDKNGWGWPWPRSAYGELVEFLDEGNAATCTFDIIFSDPSLYGYEDDEIFGRICSGFGRTVHTVFFNNQSGNVTEWPEYVPVSSLSIEGFGNAFPVTEKAVFPVPELSVAAAQLGSITGIPDSDGVFRTQELFSVFNGIPVPSLAAAALIASGSEPKMKKTGKYVEFAGKKIPVIKEASVALKFKGNLDRYIPYSISEILKSKRLYDLSKERALTEEEAEDMFFVPSDFEGKHVFVGYYAPGLYDICSTPISTVYPGVGMHITLLDNILEESFIRYTGWPVLLVTSFFTALVITMVTIGIKKIIIGIPLDIGVLILFLFVSVGLLIFGIRIPVVLPFVTGVIAFVMAMIINYVTEGKQKKYLKTAFKQYLSPAVIEKLVADPSQLKLGGERKEITIFFSDVQGFTSISEKLDPVRLTELLNEYLSFMSGIIMNSGGTIDKYEGDAIIAFWNAPTSQPDHSLRGLAAAMECNLKLQERLPYFEEKYGVRLLTRIGMNTGFAVVGNMGSRERFDYTMVGDSVNLASRLEGLNKQFGTYFMCTEKTFTSANCILVNKGKSPVPGRKLATVAVVGKKDSVVVYEPMTQERFEREKKTLEIFDKGRDLFYTGDFINAMKVFETVKEKDIPSCFYWEKCRDFLNNPPENWKGVWVASSK